MASTPPSKLRLLGAHVRCLLGTRWHIYLQVPARHCACSALPTSACSALPARHIYPLGTAPAHHIYLSARCPASQRSSPGCPTYVRQPERKKTGREHFHGVEPHARAKPCEKKCKLFHVSCKKTSCSTCHVMQKKTSCSTCHVMQKTACKTVQKNKLFHMSCKNHAKTMQNAARTERQPAEPLRHVLYVLYGIEACVLYT